MNNLNDDLKTVKINNVKYILILIYFIAVYSAFIYYDVSLVYHIVFIVGLVFLIINYERTEKELASVKMKNFYIKAKLSYKIEEIESEVNKTNSDFNKQVLHNILEEIEV